jgi:bifunctional N-acetylglucosamine-1-phosphate-uridyltransferase/glucosamine-1-phosphate-acetyltransferase GlmU-like protein
VIGRFIPKQRKVREISPKSNGQMEECRSRQSIRTGRYYLESSILTKRLQKIRNDKQIAIYGEDTNF